MRIIAAVRLGSAMVLSIGGLLVGTVGVALAAPNTLFVSKSHCSDLGTGTQQVPFCTIQKAVNAANAGDTVKVDKGTYAEQVVIKNSKDNLTLEGNGNNSVIQAPATMTNNKAIVTVTKATGVAIRDFTIAGPGSSGCDSLEYGVRVQDNAQVTIANNHITDIRDQPFSGCQNGTAIQVGRDHTGTNQTTDPDDKTTGSAIITNNKIDNYQKNGISVSRNGSTADIRQNTVTGAGPTGVIAQNGIQVSSNASATIAQNTVKNNSYSPQTVSSTGILLISPKNGVSVTQNTLNNNDVGLYVSDTKNSTFSQNTANNSVFNGIYADQDSKNNSFTQNSAHKTSGSNDPQYPSYDVEDDSTGNGTLHTANTWRQNDCKTSLPAQLCRV